ncbi:MAG TPA: HNH endonuclease signature motif containing protein [Gaiellaceae bacterium]
MRARDKTCQLADDTCYVRLEVHHVQPVTEGGPMWELDNLRVLCQSHHHRIEHELKRQRHDQWWPPKIIS